MLGLSVWMVYVTCRNEREALRIGRTCVKEKLAACANILPRIRSFYLWKGKYYDQRESLLLLKTIPRRYKKLEKRIRQLHTYTVPGIVAYPSKAGFAPYVDWVMRETRARR